MQINGSIALVTGASSGIGEATAQRLSTAGYKVYGTSRHSAQSGHRSVAMLPLDVTRDESVEAAVRELMRLEGRIDLLVNNAGFGVAPAGAEESSIEQAKAILKPTSSGLSAHDPCGCAAHATSRKRSHHQHRLGAWFPSDALRRLYAATKHAVEGYSESLDHELRTRGIRVSVIEPAYTRTKFDTNFLAPDSKLDEYRAVRALLVGS